MEQRHCYPQTAATTPAVVAPCAHAPCPAPNVTVNCPEAKPVIQEKYIIKDAPVPVPRGNFFAGAGPLYSAGWGGEAAVGYRWANGWMLMAGPTYVPHDSYASAATNCRAGGNGLETHGCPCVTLPYSVDARSAWGGTALLLYNFK